jgi:hypothetical protein
MFLIIALKYYKRKVLIYKYRTFTLYYTFSVNPIDYIALIMTSFSWEIINMSEHGNHLQHMSTKIYIGTGNYM